MGVVGSDCGLAASGSYGQYCENICKHKLMSYSYVEA